MDLVDEFYSYLEYKLREYKVPLQVFQRDMGVGKAAYGRMKMNGSLTIRQAQQFARRAHFGLSFNFNPKSHRVVIQQELIDKFDLLVESMEMPTGLMSKFKRQLFDKDALLASKDTKTLYTKDEEK